MEHNENIAKIFDKLARQFKNEIYRKRAYENAAEEIRHHQHLIISGSQAQKIRGIGKSIAAKIDEILKTGTVSTIKEPSKEEIEMENTLKIFSNIHGVGNKTAEKWYNKGYKTLKNLAILYPNMTDAQKLGYYYYNQLNLRIPRFEMTQISKVIDGIMYKMNLKYMICGSYRREEKDSGDIDCLIKSDGTTDLKDIVDMMIKQGLIIGKLALGKSKYMGICRLDKKHNARRIDLLIVTKETWAYSTLYFTGSKNLNVRMRAKANELGLTMNEYRMIDKEGVYIPAKTEKDIFDYLGIKYLEPNER